MAHNLGLDKQSGEYNFVCVGDRQSAWHGLGQRVDQAMTWNEAYQLAHLDFEVLKAPLANTLMLQDLTSELRAVDAEATGINRLMMADRIDACMADRLSYSIFRADTRKQLGTVKEAYQPIQNREAFAFCDSLVEGGHVRYEAAGALGGGERIWVLAKANRQLMVRGTEDTTDCYLLFTTSHDGSEAARCMITTVRVVCHEKGTPIIDGDWRGLVEDHPSATGSKSAKGYEIYVRGLPFPERVTEEHRYWARQQRRSVTGKKTAGALCASWRNGNCDRIQDWNQC